MSPKAPRPQIPVFEREVIDAEARRRGGDYDKVRTSTHRSVSWEGVQVESRYSDASELTLMLDMVDALPPRKSARLNGFGATAR